jgi:SAM-dependent methyltransferase
MRTEEIVATGEWLPHGYGRQLTDEEIARGVHRDFVGGMWERLGRLQFEYLCARGLQPGDRILDVGCGALRGGIHFIRYLDPGCYYGIDMNASLLAAGRDAELSRAGLTDRNPHLLLNERFEFDRFGVTFPWALAQSVFTHLPVNSIERCLVNMAAVLEPGGRFYATYFEAPSPHHIDEIEHAGGAVTFSDANPFHYHFSVFGYLVRDLPLSVSNIGPWNHPRSQHMLEFVRV